MIDLWLNPYTSLPGESHLDTTFLRVLAVIVGVPGLSLVEGLFAKGSSRLQTI